MNPIKWLLRRLIKYALSEKNSIWLGWDDVDLGGKNLYNRANDPPPGVTKHTDLTDKEVAGVIDHADASIPRGKLVSPIELTSLDLESVTADPTVRDGTIWVRTDLGEIRVGLRRFYGVLRSAASPYTRPQGIGGDATTIWHCDYALARVYELSTADLSVVRWANAPAGYPHGMGGDASVIWFCDVGVDDVFELSTTDFSAVRSAAAPATLPRGIGGDAATIWHCDYGTDRVYELSTTDFSVVRYAASPYAFPNGIGGDAAVIWHCDDAKIDVYELSTADFSIVRSGNSPYSGPSGIGGTPNVIWHCDDDADRVYELFGPVAVTLATV